MTYTRDEDFADFLTQFGQPFAAKAADEACCKSIAASCLTSF